jgi:hypothetical protein
MNISKWKLIASMPFSEMYNTKEADYIRELWKQGYKPFQIARITKTHEPNIINILKKLALL